MCFCSFILNWYCCRVCAFIAIIVNIDVIYVKWNYFDTPNFRKWLNSVNWGPENIFWHILMSFCGVNIPQKYICNHHFLLNKIVTFITIIIAFNVKQIEKPVTNRKNTYITRDILCINFDTHLNRIILLCSIILLY